MNQQQEYAPWQRTESDDLQVLAALDNASENQLASFIDELFDIAEAQKEKTKAA